MPRRKTPEGSRVLVVVRFTGPTAAPVVHRARCRGIVISTDRVSGQETGRANCHGAEHYAAQETAETGPQYPQPAEYRFVAGRPVDVTCPVNAEFWRNKAAANHELWEIVSDVKRPKPRPAPPPKEKEPATKEKTPVKKAEEPEPEEVA